MSYAKGSNRFCKLLREAIKDEKKAHGEYTSLADAAPTRQMATAIRRVRAQEDQHKVKLSRMHRRHCK